MAQMTTDIGDGRRERDGALHPLDPLTPAELQAVVDIVRAAKSLDHRHLFVTVQLDEPSKAAVTAWSDGDALDRVARVVVWNQQTATISEGTVSVTGEVRTWRDVPGAKAPALIPRRSPQSRRPRPTRASARAWRSAASPTSPTCTSSPGRTARSDRRRWTTAGGWRGHRCSTAPRPTTTPTRIRSMVCMRSSIWIPVR